MIGKEKAIEEGQLSKEFIDIRMLRLDILSKALEPVIVFEDEMSLNKTSIKDFAHIMSIKFLEHPDVVKYLTEDYEKSERYYIERYDSEEMNETMDSVTMNLVDKIRIKKIHRVVMDALISKNTLKMDNIFNHFTQIKVSKIYNRYDDYIFKEGEWKKAFKKFDYDICIIFMIYSHNFRKFKFKEIKDERLEERYIMFLVQHSYLIENIGVNFSTKLNNDLINIDLYSLIEKADSYCNKISPKALYRLNGCKFSREEETIMQYVNRNYGRNDLRDIYEILKLTMFNTGDRDETERPMHFELDDIGYSMNAIPSMYYVLLTERERVDKRDKFSTRGDGGLFMVLKLLNALYSVTKDFGIYDLLTPVIEYYFKDFMVQIKDKYRYIVNESKDYIKTTHKSDGTVEYGFYNKITHDKLEDSEERSNSLKKLCRILVNEYLGPNFKQMEERYLEVAKKPSYNDIMEIKKRNYGLLFIADISTNDYYSMHLVNALDLLPISERDFSAFTEDDFEDVVNICLSIYLKKEIGALSRGIEPTPDFSKIVINFIYTLQLYQIYKYNSKVSEDVMKGTFNSLNIDKILTEENNIKFEMEHMKEVYALTDVIKDKEEEIDKLKQLVRDKQDLQYRNEQLNKNASELERENNRLKKELERLEQKLQEVETEVESSISEYIVVEDDIYLTYEEILEELNDMRVTLVGGPEPFVNKLMEQLPGLTFFAADAKNTKLDIKVGNSDIVMISDDYISHNVYDKALEILRDKNIPYYYIGRKRNIETILTEVYQLWKERNED